MRSDHERRLTLAGTFNVRDLGGYRVVTGETQWRRLLRGDSLHQLDETGVATLAALGVTTLIDLRREDEIEHRPDPPAAHLTFNYHHVSLLGSLLPDEQTGSEMLRDLYIRALDERQEAMCQVMTLIAEAPDGGVLFHCAAGKDRTGLIAALILGLAGADRATILEDYALTAALTAPQFDDIVAETLGSRDALAKYAPLFTAAPETMAAAIDHIIARYENIAHYLSAAGLSSENAARIKSRLLSP